MYMCVPTAHMEGRRQPLVLALHWRQGFITAAYRSGEPMTLGIWSPYRSPGRTDIFC